MNAACNWLARVLQALTAELRGVTRPELTRRALRLTVVPIAQRTHGRRARRR